MNKKVLCLMLAFVLAVSFFCTSKEAFAKNVTDSDYPNYGMNNDDGFGTDDEDEEDEEDDDSLFDLDPDEDIEMYGHRGYSGAYLENSIPSIVGAAQASFDGIEIDIWESQNGDIMVFHDYNTKRFCKRNTYIWKVNKKNRKNYLMSDSKGKGIVIPTLDEVLSVAKDNDLKVLCHIKTYKKYTLTSRGVDKIVNTIQKYKMQKNTVIFTSKKSDLKPFVNKGVRIGIVAGQYERSTINSHIRWLVKNGGDTLIISSSLTMRDDDFGEDLVDMCHRNGIQIGTYNTMDQDEYDYLKKINVDFAMTNNPYR